jgi:DNA-directed RNA polymerase subunit RPC12/RpoP
MIHLNCPWCEADQRVELTELEDEFVCPACATRVLLETAPEPTELALAA